MNLQKLTTGLTKSVDQLNTCLINDAKEEFAHIFDPDQCGWIVRRHFNGLMGLIYVFIILFLLSAVVGFALYARQ
jgi:hypothetical protein